MSSTQFVDGQQNQRDRGLVEPGNGNMSKVLQISKRIKSACPHAFYRHQLRHGIK